MAIQKLIQKNNGKLSIRQRIAQYVGCSVTCYHRLRGCDIGMNCRISKSAILDRANPKGVHIGNNTRVLIDAMIPTAMKF